MKKMTQTIAPWPHYHEDEISSVVKVLQSGKVNYWTGEICKAFEKEYAAYVGVPFGIAVANGTVALELALYALGIGAGDEVITTSRTYIATASSVVLRGAMPVPVDVEYESQNISPDAIKKAITPKTRAIIVVHLAGWPCDMDSILAIAKEHNLRVIEDCAQANGARYGDRQIGSFGDAAAFSFCQDKIITTGGEGGMLVLKSEEAWKKAWAYKDIGRSYDAVYNRQHSPGFRWLTESFGTNWRMTEMQACIGKIQLSKLDSQINLRRRNADLLTEAFKNVPAFRVTLPEPHVFHSYYKYYVFLRPEMLGTGWDRDQIIEEINKRGLPCFSGSCSEIYLEKAFESLPTRPTVRLPIAKELGETSLMFLVHPTLSEDYMREAAEVVLDVMSMVTRS